MNQKIRNFPKIITIILMILFFYIPPCPGKDNMRGPTEPQSVNQLEIYGSGDNFLLNIYQKWISPVKGGNTCPMYPACSQYAKIAVEVLPWYKAYTSSLERLLRCGNDLHLYPIIFIHGQIHWHDPVISEDSNHDSKSRQEDY